ncbi:Hypothetical protein CINCED_3A013907 [Cinara cedri]|uniref:Uncharacterized protein n=1 Tax=Cinara cedri TaxID=506608 RepID=A0A5E4M3C5_9HEMI|nr:Hypothetical protein CINCED_3A013907 [Cinara cedri]
MTVIKRFQTRLRRRRSLQFHVGIAIHFICILQWISVNFASAANIAVAGVAVEDKVTLPSRNEATNPLKEPTPATLQGAFLSNNLTDSNNGSISTPPADAPRRHGEASPVTSTTAAAAAAETVWNVRTAAAATLPVDSRNESTATATGPVGPSTTDRPLESWENVIHTSTQQLQSSPPPTQSTVDPTTKDMVSGGDYGASAVLNNKNLMANMLKSWFNQKDDSDYKQATKFHENNVVLVRGRGSQPSNTVSSSSKIVTAAAVSSNKSLFERWDEASEEQERVLEDAMRSERPFYEGGGDSSSSPSSSSSSSVLAADQNTPSRWFVLLLSGNSTVAQMRRTDFAKYLKLNLAARLSLEYDEVKINRVLVVPPRLMVNVSVVPVSERASTAAAAVAAAATAAAAAAAASSSSSSWPSSLSSAADPSISDRVIEDDDPLHNLVETNATLMELSGEEYRVERFMSLKSQKPQTMEEAAAVVSNRHADIDFFIYATVGPLCFIVVLGFLLRTLYKYVRKHSVQWPWKRKFRQPSFWPGGRVDQRHHRMTDECSGDCGDSRGDCGASLSLAEEIGGCGSSVNVIYSGEFEQSQQQQLSGSWLDDANFVPDDSLDRIRTPTLLRTAAPQPTTAAAIMNNNTFTDILGDGGGHHHHHHHRHHHHQHSSRNGQCAAVAAAAAAAAVATTAVHAQSPRLSRDNKLRILGCKQSCLLLPAVQPIAAAAAAAAVTSAADDNEDDKTTPTSQSSSTAVGQTDCDQL